MTTHSANKLSIFSVIWDRECFLMSRSAKYLGGSREFDRQLAVEGAYIPTLYELDLRRRC